MSDEKPEPNSTGVNTLKARVPGLSRAFGLAYGKDNGKIYVDLECNPWPITEMDWTPGSYGQAQSRLNRKPLQGSRNFREGHYNGGRKGRHYRSKIVQFGYPVVGTYQVERCIWARADRTIKRLLHKSRVKKLQTGLPSIDRLLNQGMHKGELMLFTTNRLPGRSHLADALQYATSSGRLNQKQPNDQHDALKKEK